MKKAISILMLIALAAALSGCAGGNNTNVDGDALSVVATSFPCYDFARAVLGGDAEITMLLSPGMESHAYDPTASDMLRIQKCDLFVCVGGESEAWVERVLSSAEGVRVIRLIDCADLLREEHVEGMTVGGEEHSEEYDEHVWTSPVNAMRMVENVRDALCEIAPANADTYKANAGAYLDELTKLDADFRAVVAGGKRKTVVFGDRFPLLYFARAYDLTYYAAFPGCGSETEPSVSSLVTLVDMIENEDIPVVFAIELSNQKVARTLADETGATVVTFQTCHNLTKDDFDAGETYVSLMRRNVESLKIALN